LVDDALAVPASGAITRVTWRRTEAAPVESNPVQTCRSRLKLAAPWAAAVLVTGLVVSGASYKFFRPQATHPAATTAQAPAPSTPAPRATRTASSLAISGLPALGSSGGSGFLSLPGLPDTPSIESSASPAPPQPASISSQTTAPEAAPQAAGVNQARGGGSGPPPAVAINPPAAFAPVVDSTDSYSSTEVPVTATPTQTPVSHPPVVLSAPQLLPVPTTTTSGAQLPTPSLTPAAAPYRISTPAGPQGVGTSSSANQTAAQPQSESAISNSARVCPPSVGTAAQACPVATGQR
jgi:hypothetical protein